MIKGNGVKNGFMLATYLKIRPRKRFFILYDPFIQLITSMEHYYNTRL